MYCLNCGKLTKKKKFCSKDCMTIYQRKETELKRPPLYTECQFCGKKLQHRVAVKENNERKKTMYYSNKKYCDKHCEGEHKKILMKGKPCNFKNKKVKSNINIEFPVDITDPLTFKEVGEENV